MELVMEDERVQFPVKLEVTKHDYGKLRSIDVVDEDATEEFVDTQEWRLESLKIESFVRDQIEVGDFEETAKLGTVVVKPESLEWEFVRSEDQS